MEDKDIIKALECCEKFGTWNCEECPYKKCNSWRCCVSELCIDALDLINRQKAEIESLKSEIKELEDEIDKQYETAEADIRAAIANSGTSCHWCEEILRQEVKTETVKEVAERFKRYIHRGHLKSPTKICFSELDIIKMLNNFKNEMLGETEGKDK